MSPRRSRPEELTPGQRRLNESIRETLASVPGEPTPVSLADRRRVGARPSPSRFGLMRVIERDGVVSLEDAAETAPVGVSRRRRARQIGLGGTVLDEVPFERLPPNAIVQALEALDRRLNPMRGLRLLGSGGELSAPEAPPVPTGRILLLIHGTFSNSDHLWRELQANPHIHQFLSRASAEYDQILLFDHPTVSVSPILDARALAVALEGSEAEIDVIAHSRGGLVARWWAEALDRASRRVRSIVFVGSPLAGTGLAAPPRLRSTLSLLASFSRALGEAAEMAAFAFPFAAVAAELFRIGSSLTGAVAATPIVDAVLAMVPGITAMSRVGNNRELVSLREGPTRGIRYHAIQANFESEKVGWRFWRAFRGLPDRLADQGADVVFEGENDLVVDTISMTALSDSLRLPAEAVLDFGTTDVVHHTNYFRQQATLAFIAEKLELTVRPPGSGRGGGR
jgi:hypothetical protein